jgi:hypothetical protein
MKLIALVAAATLMVAAPLSGIAAPTAFGLKINPLGHAPCGPQSLMVGTTRRINTGTHSHPLMTTVTVTANPGGNDKMIVMLNWQVSTGMAFDEVDISGVCSIDQDGTIETWPGGTPDMDVTIKFRQPISYTWPSSNPYEATQSRIAPPYPANCTLKSGSWAWSKLQYPQYQPAIDSSAHLTFTMPVHSGQIVYYQLYYADRNSGAPIGNPLCVDPDIVNH